VNYPNTYTCNADPIYEGLLGASPERTMSVFCHRGAGVVEQTRRSGAAITLADPPDHPIGLLYHLRIIGIVVGNVAPPAFPHGAPPADINERVPVVPEPQAVIVVASDNLGNRPQRGLLLAATRRDDLPADLQKLAAKFPDRIASARFFVSDAGATSTANVFHSSQTASYEGILGVKSAKKNYTSFFCHRGDGVVEQTRYKGAAITLANPTDYPIGLLYHLRVAGVVVDGVLGADIPAGAPPADINERVPVVPEP
jgi:hypothetical protein